jgi:FkbM family methyltransferase
MTMLQNFLKSRGRLVHRLSQLIPDVAWTVNVRPVGPMRIRLRLNKGLWIRDVFQHERHQFGIINSLIRPGDTVYDVGSNIGYVLRFMMGPCRAGKAYAFEPVPFNRFLLEKNIKLGGVEDRITVIPCAVSDQDGEIEFTLDDFTGATGHIGAVHSDGQAWEDRWGTKFKKIKVPMVKLDTLLAQGRIEPPRLIKVDIEGAEEFCVLGARELLKAHQPRLVMELHTLEQARATMRHLDDLGYHQWGHVDIVERPERRRYTREMIEAAKTREDLPFHLYAVMDPSELDREIPPYAG